METRWIEREDGGSFVVEVNGIDHAKKEAAEIETFARYMKLSVDGTPPPEKTSPFDVAVLFAAVFFGWFVLDLVAGWVTPAHHGPSLLLGVFGAAFFIPLLAVLAARKRAKDKEKAQGTPFQERFTFAFADGSFSFRGRKRDELRLPVATVMAFEPRRRGLVLVTTDGARTELPCDLGAESTHRDLAARLGQELARARATADGYRGAVRVAAEPEPEASSGADEGDDGDEADENADAKRHASGS